MASEDQKGVDALEDEVEWDPRWDEEEEVDNAAEQFADDEVSPLVPQAINISNVSFGFVMIFYYFLRELKIFEIFSGTVIIVA